MGRRCFSRGLWTWKGLFPWRPGAWPLRGARGSHSPARAETRQGSLRHRPPHSGRHRAASVRGAFEWLEGHRAPWDGCLRAPLAAHRRLPCVSGVFWSPSVGTLGDARAPLLGQCGALVPAARSSRDRAPGGTRGSRSVRASAPPPSHFGHSALTGFRSATTFRPVLRGRRNHLRLSLGVLLADFLRKPTPHLPRQTRASRLNRPVRGGWAMMPNFWNNMCWFELRRKKRISNC